MIRTKFGLLVLLAFLPALSARDKAETPTPAQQYKALLKEYEKAQIELVKAAQAAAKDPKKPQMAIRLDAPVDKFTPRFLELAEKNPKDPAAVSAMKWIVTHTSARPGKKSDPGTPRAKAIKILLRDHIRSEKMADLCQNLSYAEDNDSRQLLRAIFEKNPHRSVQAQACLGLAQQADNQLRMARRCKNDPAEAKEAEEYLGKEAVAELMKADTNKLSKKAEDWYERIVKEFADVPAPRGGTLGKLAEKKLEALRHPILVGKPAPEIEAEDIDGRPFKLSDYRGKVVLLDFWGNW